MLFTNSGFGRMPTTLRRQIAVLAAASIALAVLTLGSASTAVADGCSHSDHAIWMGNHYWEGHFNSQNSHFEKWWEVSLGSGGWNYTWCGCVDPNKPCVNSVPTGTQIQHEH